MGGTAWTPQDDAELKELLAQGVKRKAIARKLDRTLPAMLWRMKQLGLTKTKQKPNPDAIKMTVSLPPEVYQGVSKLAANSGTTIASVLARLLKQALKDEKTS